MTCIASVLLGLFLGTIISSRDSYTKRQLAIKYPVKLEFLQQNAPIGAEIEILLLGGEKVVGTVERFADALVVVKLANGREKFISEEAVVAFESLASGSPESAPAELVILPDDQSSIEEERAAADPLTAETALNTVNEVRAALERKDISAVVRLASEMATQYGQCSEKVQRDNPLRWALISGFKALENQRKLLLAQNKADPQALVLSESLLSLNRALRLPGGMSDENIFSDLYHFYVSVRTHIAHFQANGALWEELSAALRRGYELGHDLLLADGSERVQVSQPHRQATLLYRISEICLALIECGFATAEEQEELLRQHQSYAAKAGRSPKMGAQEAVGMGKVVAFGQRKCLIQARDQRTLFFTLRDVTTSTLRQQIEQSGSENPVEVDYDEEPRPTQPYDAALRVRPPMSMWGRVKELCMDLPKRFGFINLPDGRDVHFPFYALPDPENAPAIGTPVLCIPRRGHPKRRPGFAGQMDTWTTERVVLVDDLPETATNNKAAQQYIDRANRAADVGDFRSARACFLEGLRNSPTPHLVLAYAGWLKEHSPHETGSVFERGMAQFPEAYQLVEHAGSFAASQGDFDKSITLLDRSLEIVRSTPARAGEKGVLLSLARVYFQIGTEEAYKKAAGYFDEVAQLFGGWDHFRAKMPRSDVTKADAAQAAVARLRTMSNRGGAIALEFLSQLGFDVQAAKFSEDGQIADVVCEAREPHLLADFGIRPRVLVHLVLSPPQPNESLSDLEIAAREHVIAQDTDANVVFLIAPSIPTELRNRLKNRKNPRPQPALMIIPLGKSELESVADPARLFRDTLADWLWGRDVFTLTAWVKGDDFFGRRPLLADLHDMIAISQPIGLFGLRKTGKTSVLQALREREEAEENVVLYVDMFEGEALEKLFPWVYWTLANELQRYAQGYLDRDFEWTLGGKYQSHDKFGSLSVSDAFFAELKKVLSAFARQPAGSRRIVLMLDEWEVLYHHDAVQTFRFLGGLRGAQQSFPNVLSIICTGANASVSEIPQIKGRDNPVFSYLKPFYLPLLSQQECQEMIQSLGLRSGVKFEVDAIREVYRQAAGHPLVTRGLCAIASRRNQKQSATELAVSAQDILVAAKRYRQENRHVFQEIHDRLNRDYPEELGILNQLARSGIPHRRQQRNQDGAIDHLCSYQIVEEADAGVRIRMRMLQDWLNGSPA